MSVVPVTRQTEHEQVLKHKSPLAAAKDFSILVNSDPKAKKIIGELRDVYGLMAAAVCLPNDSIETEARTVTKL